jgi:hypothetical protein
MVMHNDWIPVNGLVKGEAPSDDEIGKNKAGRSADTLQLQHSTVEI